MTAALEVLERWSAKAAVVIFVGIALEAWGTIHFQKPTESNFEVAIILIADGAIGIGLIIEVVCILRAIVETRCEKTESDEKIAEANARAREAERETERLRAQFSWRRLDMAATKALFDALADFPVGKVTFVHAVSDWESLNFAKELAAAFSYLTWDVIFVSAAYSGDITFGVRVPIDFGDERAAMARHVGDSFQRAGIKFLFAPAPPAFMTTPSKPTAGNVLRAVVYVGPKPPVG